MTDPLYQASNEAAIFARLTKAMGMPLGFGGPEEARREAPPRITWVWKGESHTPDPEQDASDMAVGYEANPLFDVHVWGRDYLDACRLRNLLAAALFNELSPGAYKSEGAKPGTDDEGLPLAQGCEMVISIRLLGVPMPFRRHQQVTLTGASAQGTVTGPAGEAPTSDAGTIVAGT